MGDGKKMNIFKSLQTSGEAVVGLNIDRPIYISLPYSTY